MGLITRSRAFCVTRWPRVLSVEIVDASQATHVVVVFEGGQ